MSGSRLIRADLHNHTHYSPDSILSPKDFARRAHERKGNVVAAAQLSDPAKAR